MKGSDFIKRARALSSIAEVEELVIDCVKQGYHVPWPMVPIPFGNDSWFMAAVDYLSIGTFEDYVHIPVSAVAGQRICDLLGWTLPTSRMVDMVHAEADIKLQPQPMGPPTYPYDASMMSVARFAEHSRWCRNQLKELGYTEHPRKLVAGHKKDVVLSNKLETRPGKLALYGLHEPDGTPIQGPTVNAVSHYNGYRDYLQGLRGFSSCMTSAGVQSTFVAVAGIGSSPLMGETVMTPSGRYVLDRGPLRVFRQPGVPIETPSGSITPAKPTRPVLRRGSKGDLVREWQLFLLSKEGDLGRWGADGDFGPMTEAATKDLQKDAALPQTGVVDASTWNLFEAPTEPEPHARTIVAIPPPSEIPFLQAKNWTRATDGRDVLWIVIHTMEAPEHPRTAENVAAWFAGPNAPQASAHYNVDCDSIVQSVREEHVAWHAAAANRRGIGLEHAGYARQTDHEWHDKASLLILGRSAGLAADIAQRHSIPVEFVDAEGLLRGDRGFTYHSEVSKACRLAKQRNVRKEPWFRNGRWSYTDHGDPGSRFPLDEYLAAVRSVMEV